MEMPVQSITAKEDVLHAIATSAHVQTSTPNFAAYILEKNLQSDNLKKHFTKETNPASLFNTTALAPLCDPERSEGEAILPYPKDCTTLMPQVSHCVQNEVILSDSKQHFINTMLPYAAKAASLLGVDPLILIAQAALETGWGKRITQDTNNMFNIKAVGQQAASEIKTTEYVNHQAITVRASFKKYDSISESFLDYAHLLSKSERYQEVLQQGDNAKAYYQALQQAGYATDPHYADKLMMIYSGLVQEV